MDEPLYQIIIGGLIIVGAVFGAATGWDELLPTLAGLVAGGAAGGVIGALIVVMLERYH